MFYRETGQFKSNYQQDMALFALKEDKILVVFFSLLALAIPYIANDFVLQTIFVPFVIYALAALGLNILMGFAGQISLGTARLWVSVPLLVIKL